MQQLSLNLVAGLDLQWSTLPHQVVNGILLGAIYALIALGYTMVYGVLKLINFAHGEVFMLGAYGALFASYAMGYSPNNTLTQGSYAALVIMLLVAMCVSGGVGVLIERMAYRPLRNQARIASLITAIGVSLLLQYGGQIFLPVSPAPNIDSKVSPIQGTLDFYLKGPDQSLIAQANDMKADVAKKSAAWDAQKKIEKNEFDPSPEGLVIRKAFQDAENGEKDLRNKANQSAVQVSIVKGQLVMLGATLMLMAGLYVLVMKTKVGRAMRAVSLDFQSAALMGINVDSVITLTFLIGSALAGAGAMMSATFQGGIKIDTFFGALPGVKAFVAAVLGGIGNIPGAVLGGLLMGVAEMLVVWSGYAGYKDAIAFLILIVVLLLKPGGLLGSAKVEKV